MWVIIMLRKAPKFVTFRAMTHLYGSYIAARFRQMHECAISAIFMATTVVYIGLSSLKNSQTIDWKIVCLAKHTSEASIQQYSHFTHSIDSICLPHPINRSMFSFNYKSSIPNGNYNIGKVSVLSASY